MEASFTVDDRAYRDYLRRLALEARRAMGAALRAEAERIMAASKRLVPVDTGALRASGRVEGPVWGGETVSVGLLYGGPAAPYAVYVHENLAARHPTGQAKYLEQPVNEATAGLGDRLAERLRRALERLGR